LSFKEYLEIDSPLIPRIATGFGGGFGLKGSLCGVLVGSIMAIGLKFGRSDIKDREALLTTNTKVKGFLDRFETEFGAKDCAHLAGYRIEDKEEWKKWIDSGGVKRCNAMLNRTVQIMVDEFLDLEPPWKREVKIVDKEEGRKAIEKAKYYFNNGFN
jgi:C_GCAxxG_C_C family probable redox protein